MRLAFAVVALVLPLARFATAGPYCGGGTAWAPISDTLPVRPMVVLWAEDHTVLGPNHHAYYVEAPAFTATIEGKRVPITVHAERAGDLVLHFIQIESDRTGTLAVRHDETGQDARVVMREVHTFTIARGWKPPNPHAELGRFSATSFRMSNVTYRGLAIVVDQALAFVVRWRRDAKDRWRTVVLPARAQQGSSAAWLGETNCSAPDVPVSVLEQGIELDVTATFADGQKRHVDGLDGLVPLPPEQAPSGLVP